MIAWLANKIADVILQRISYEIADALTEVTIDRLLVAKLIAYLQPNLARDETSEEMQKESNEIGEKVLRRLLSEITISRGL